MGLNTQICCYEVYFFNIGTFRLYEGAYKVVSHYINNKAIYKILQIPHNNNNGKVFWVLYTTA